MDIHSLMVGLYIFISRQLRWYGRLISVWSASLETTIHIQVLPRLTHVVTQGRLTIDPTAQANTILQEKDTSKNLKPMLFSFSFSFSGILNIFYIPPDNYGKHASDGYGCVPSNLQSPVTLRYGRTAKKSNCPIYNVSKNLQEQLRMFSSWPHIIYAYPNVFIKYFMDQGSNVTWNGWLRQLLVKSVKVTSTPKL